MKKTIISMVLAMAFGMPAFAQYWTTYGGYDPFSNGDKHIGLMVGTGGWFSNFEYNISNSSYSSKKVTDVERALINPSISLHYKRVLSGNTVDWGSSFLLSYTTWGGKYNVLDTAAKTTFTTKYSYSEVTLSDLIYLMVPIGDDISINAGVGLTIGLGLAPKLSTESSDGSTEEAQGQSDFGDMLIGRINAMVGADYHLSDSFTVSANLIAWPLDIFSLLGESKMRGIGNGVSMSDKMPFQLMVGFTYAL